MSFSFGTPRPVPVKEENKMQKSAVVTGGFSFSSCYPEPVLKPVFGEVKSQITSDDDSKEEVILESAVKPASTLETINLLPSNQKTECTAKNAFKLNLLKTPWRELSWSTETKKDLLKIVKSYKPASNAVSRARVLLLGPIGAGKSSFISSVQSVFSGRVLNRAIVGSYTSSSCTKKLHSFNIRSSNTGSESTSLVLCDIMGFGEGDYTGLSLYDALCVIKGHVPEGHRFSAEEPVTSDMVGFIKKPHLRDKIHCVVFVLDAKKILTYPKGLSTMFQRLREHISSLGVHQVALLTHVDEVCTDTAQDISQVYRSRSLQQTITKAGELLGMATSYILPVKNYSSQLALDKNMDVLLLSAVDHIMQYVDLHFLDSSDLQDY